MAGPKKSSPTINEAKCVLKYRDFADVKNVYGFPPSWEAELPKHGVLASAPPHNKMALYIEHLTAGNLRLPVTKFMQSILTTYGLHLTQIHPFGMLRIRHFEFCCQAHDYDPTVGMFAVFYKMTCRDGWFSFATTGKGTIGFEWLRSISGWKNKFFWIREDVVPFTMIRRDPKDPLPEIAVAAYEQMAWFTTLTKTQTPMRPIHEATMVCARMSRLWPFPSLEPYYENTDKSEGMIISTLVDSIGGMMVRREITVHDVPFLDRTKNYFVFSTSLTPEPLVSEAMYAQGEEFVKKCQGILQPRPITAVTSSGVIVHLSSSEETSLGNEEHLIDTANTTMSNVGLLRKLELKSSVVDIDDPDTNLPSGEEDEAVPKKVTGKRKKRSSEGELKKTIKKKKNQTDHPILSARLRDLATQEASKGAASTSRPSTPSSSPPLTQPDPIPISDTPPKKNKEKVADDKLNKNNVVKPVGQSGVRDGAALFRPKWTLREDSIFDKADVCQALVDELLPPAEKERQRLQRRTDLFDANAFHVANSLSINYELRRDYLSKCEELDDAFEATLSAKREAMRCLTETQRANKAMTAAEAGQQAAEQAKTMLQKQVDDQAKQIKQLQAEAAVKDKRLSDLSLKSRNQAQECDQHNLDLIRAKANQKWLLSAAIPKVITDIRNSDDLGNCVAILLRASEQLGRKIGFEEAYEFLSSGRLREEHSLATIDAQAILDEKTEDFDNLKFSLSDHITELADKDDAIDQLKELIGFEEEGESDYDDADVP